PRQESQTTAPCQESQTTLPRQESQTTLPRQESQTTLPRQESQTTAPCQESQTMAPRQESQITAPRQRSQTPAPRKKSQVVASRRESQTTASRRESEIRGSCRESQTPLSRRESQITIPRRQSTNTTVAKKRVKIYKNGDDSFEGIELIIDTDQLKNMQAILDVINEKIDVKHGAKKLYTTSGQLIQSLDEINDNKEYVAATTIFIPLLYGQMKFVTANTGILRENSDVLPTSTKVALPLRKWGSVDLKKMEGKENTKQKKNKSSMLLQNQSSIENIPPEDKKKKAKKLVKKSIVAAATTNNLSDSTKASSSNLTSPSSTRSCIFKAKPSKRKMHVKMNPDPMVIPAALPKYPLVSTVQNRLRSVKNRAPTPKPGTKNRQSDKGN
ncbi:unnamed protein product, partial [Onchocerca ochengi]